ncbi:MAG: cysteine desulfurase [Chlamydiota bacterium]
MNADFAHIRQDFPMLQQKMHGKPLVYLDSAATSQKPNKVIDTLCNFYRNHYGTVHRAVYELSLYATQEYSRVKEVVRQFINARYADEIVYTSGTTEGINLVASSFGKAFINSGDEIVISHLEHHSNLVPWQLLCEERGATLKVAPIDDHGEIILKEYSKLLSSKTKIVSIGHVANSLGTINPIKEIIDLAHQAGAKVLVDGAQAAPHLPIDVQDLDADFYVFSGHKNFGPTGVGVLYGKKELLEELPPYHGGGDMIDKVTLEKSTYNPPPLKFEAGTPMIAQVIGLGSALEYMMNIGQKEIYHYEHQLLELLYKGLEQSAIEGLKILGPPLERRSSIVSFTVDGLHPLDLGTMLDFKGIAIRTGHHCAMPTMDRLKLPGTVRASLAFYNNRQDIERFIQALQEVVHFLRKSH